MPWFIWLLIAALALAGEAMSTALVLVYVGVAAAITAVLAAVGVPAVLQFIIFIPLTLALLRVVRPHTLALIGGRRPRLQLSHASRMIDRNAVVEQQVSDDGGMVRLGSGEFWSARAFPPGVVLPKGTLVRVMFVEGVTVYVSTPTESGRLPDLPPDVQALDEEGA
ncbi:MAG TPA: NfeD family protein [Chloroflexota bacterium]|jgi:membrane protein implicated in regulation of membrane protease activity|nr:NfeD family protein [Chloroflexota bacterium]